MYFDYSQQKAIQFKIIFSENREISTKNYILHNNKKILKNYFSTHILSK